MSNIIDSIQLSGVTYQIQGSGGGGKAIEAGRGISITTGETADTVSFNLPISAGTGTNSIAEGNNTKANGSYSHAEGSNSQAKGEISHAEGGSTTASGNSSHAEGRSTKAIGIYSHAEGYHTTANNDKSHAEGNYTAANGTISHAEGNYTTANGNNSHAEGGYTEANNLSEHASGQYNVSSRASTTFGDSGNTLFSVGNGTYDYSTDTEIRHNAFEIRQNGDIYISSGNTDIKLQDHLGGGSVTVDTELDSGSTNPVENRVIYNKIDEVEEVTAAALNELNEAVSGKQDTLSAGTNITIVDNVISAEGGGSVTVDTELDSGSTNPVENRVIYNKIDEVEQVTAAGLNAVNDKFGGLKLVKLTQAQYDALTTKDPSTLYVIVD